MAARRHVWTVRRASREKPALRPVSCDCCQKPNGFVYRGSCLACCVRLVLTAHPNRYTAAALLAAIERHPQAQPRTDIVAAVRMELENRSEKGKKQEDENPFPMVS
jgi:hypothetical protein